MWKIVLLNQFLPGILDLGMRKIHPVVQYVDIQGIELPVYQHILEIAGYGYVIVYKTQDDGIRKADCQTLGQAVHIVEAIVAVNGGDSGQTRPAPGRQGETCSPWRRVNVRCRSRLLL
jgi:ArsR family metal-binding transcriptional regulator